MLGCSRTVVQTLFIDNAAEQSVLAGEWNSKDPSVQRAEVIHPGMPEFEKTATLSSLMSKLGSRGSKPYGQLTQRLEWTRIGRKRCSEDFAFTAAVFLRLSPSPDVWSLCQSQLSHLSLRFTVERNGPAQFCFLLISLPTYLLPRINIFEKHCTHGDSFRDII